MPGLFRNFNTSKNTRVFTGSGNTSFSYEEVIVVKKTSGAATTVTLPKGTENVTAMVVDGKGDAATNNITVDGYSSETINGAATYVINSNYGAATFQWNGTEWNLVTTVINSSSDTLGAVAGTGNAAVESNAIVHNTVITATNLTVALTDSAGVVAYLGQKIYDFPAGVICVLGATSNLAITKSSAGVNADWDGDFGIGSVTASNNATLSSTEQNIIPTTATPQAVSGATTATGGSTAIAYLDGSATAADAYLNVLVDDADHDVTTTPCNLIFNGTIKLYWINLGDF